jgi:hypothetical protein
MPAQQVVKVVSTKGLVALKWTKGTLGLVWCPYGFAGSTKLGTQQNRSVPSRESHESCCTGVLYCCHMQFAPFNPPKLATQPLPAPSQPSTCVARRNVPPTSRQGPHWLPPSCARPPTPGVLRQAAVYPSVSSLLVEQLGLKALRRLHCSSNSPRCTSAGGSCGIIW